MTEQSLEELRRIPGFPQPGPWTRLSLWFDAHKGVSITLWLAGLLIGQFVYMLFVWAPYAMLASRGRKKYMKRVDAWFAENGPWYEANYQADHEWANAA